MKSILSCFLILAFFYGCCHVQPKNRSTKEYATQNYAVQFISESVDGQGFRTATGFAINKDYFVSVAHFCAPLVEGPEAEFFDEEDIQMIYIDKFGRQNIKRKVEVVAIDEEIDICLLKKENHKIKPVAIINNFSEVNIGDDIVSIGSPESWYPSVRYGNVVVPDESLSFSPLQVKENGLILNLESCPGCSGSPIILIDKEAIIGMVLMIPKKCNLLTFAVSAVQIKDFLDSNGQQYIQR